MNHEFLQAIGPAAAAIPGPKLMPWSGTNGWRSFATFAEWCEAIGELGLCEVIPEIVRTKFDRARKLYVLGWIDIDLIKAGELVVVTALELTVRDRYGDKLFRLVAAELGGPETRTRAPVSFARYLKYMVEGDGLTDAAMPMVRKHGGSVIGVVTGKIKPSLADIRNDLAHGYPFDGWPRSGLLELTRDLIEYAYRNFIAECR